MEMAGKRSSVEKRDKVFGRMGGCVVCVSEGRRFLGGGVVVQIDTSKKLVMTAAHVVDGKKDLIVGFMDGTSYKASLAYPSKSHDVALLELDIRVEDEDEDVAENIGFAEFGEIDKLVYGKEIYYIGHPGHQQCTRSEGYVCCVDRTIADVYRNDLRLVGHVGFPSRPDKKYVDDFRGLSPSLKVIQVKSVHGGGRWGGTGAPFFDADGHIVGLYTFTLEDKDYAIHGDSLQTVLEYFKSATQGKQKKEKGKQKREK